MHDNNVNLTEQFSRICRLMHISHHKAQGPTANPYRGQGRVLSLLKMQPEISQKDLSYLLDIRAQSLGELLAKLENSGCITRAPSETDNRVMNIRLTEKGAAAAERQEDGTSAAFDSLNVEEQKILSEYLDRVIAALERDFSNTSPESGPHRRHDRDHGHEHGRFAGRERGRGEGFPEDGPDHRHERDHGRGHGPEDGRPAPHFGHRHGAEHAERSRGRNDERQFIFEF